MSRDVTAEESRPKGLVRDARGFTLVEWILVASVFAATLAAVFKHGLGSAVATGADKIDLEGASLATPSTLAVPSLASPADGSPSWWQRYQSFVHDDLPAGEDSPWLREFALGALLGDFNDRSLYQGPDAHLAKPAAWGEIIAGFTPIVGTMGGVRDGIFWGVEWAAADSAEKAGEARREVAIAVVGTIPFVRGLTKAVRYARHAQRAEGARDAAETLGDAYGGAPGGNPQPAPAPAPPPPPP